MVVLALARARRSAAARRADELGPGEVRYELDEVGVRLLASRLISERPWSDFKAYRDHGELLELVPRRGPELLLTTRAFDADSLELLRQQLRRSRPRAASASAASAEPPEDSTGGGPAVDAPK